MRLTSSILSVFFLVALLVSPAPSFSQKNKPAQFEVNNAIHFEASIPEVEPLITHGLALLLDLAVPQSVTAELVKCNPASASQRLCTLPRLHLRLRVFRN